MSILDIDVRMRQLAREALVEAAGDSDRAMALLAVKIKPDPHLWDRTLRLGIERLLEDLVRSAPAPRHR